MDDETNIDRLIGKPLDFQIKKRFSFSTYVLNFKHRRKMGFCEVDIERPEKETGTRGGGPMGRASNYRKWV